MRSLFGFVGLLWLAGIVLAAGGPSYVVLQSGQNSLIRISGDGKSMTVVADGLEKQGVNQYSGLTIDSKGNYIVAAGANLLRITPAGVLSTLTEAADDRSWRGVAADGKGNIVVTDDKKPLLWRVSEDGSSVTKVAAYDAYLGTERQIGVAVDKNGDYWTVVSDIDKVPGFPSLNRIYRVSPNGTVREIHLHGERTTQFAGGLAFDADGGLVFSDYRESSLFRVSADGKVARLGTLPANCNVVSGLALDAASRYFVAATPFCNAVVRADESGIVEVLARAGKIIVPSKIAIDFER